jgi:hypothetical protein
VDKCVSDRNDRGVISGLDDPRGGLRSGDRDGLLVCALADADLIGLSARGLRSTTPAATPLPAAVTVPPFGEVVLT